MNDAAFLLSCFERPAHYINLSTPRARADVAYSLPRLSIHDSKTFGACFHGSGSKGRLEDCTLTDNKLSGVSTSFLRKARACARARGAGRPAQRNLPDQEA